MRRLLVVAVVSLFLSALTFAQASPQSQDSPKNIVSFDQAAMDKSADPCSDFYQFSCGNWIKNNPVPADRGRYGRFAELDDNNHFILREILEGASKNDPKRDATDQKIGDYYASCMDETAINKLGLSPVEPYLKQVAALKNKSELPALLGKLHMMNVGAFFNFGSEPDFKNAKMMIAATSQAGIGLPDRDYYFKDDAKSKETRDLYVKHVAKMMELAGETPESAAAKAATVMRIETALAKVSLDNVTLRDPDAVYHKKAVAELLALSPAFDWNKYFAASGAPKFDQIDVSMPEFVKGFNQVLQDESLDNIKAYISWKVLNLSAALLSKPFVDENFEFNGKVLTGAKQLRPRWRRCVNFTDGDLGEALGKAYVDKTFGAEGKARMLKMVHALEESLQKDITELPWMTDATKQAALVKLKGIENKIGYPDKWRDYSTLKIVRGDAVGNSLRANEFENKRQYAKIGKPVDKTEWQMTPPTVNAYYNPLENNINFPAGILQPPFFSNKIDDAVNLGGIGAVIGHELTHGFDDEGRKFDAEGNLRDWWTDKDAKAFEERAQCIVDEYNNFVVVDDVHINGKLTLGENTADNGGLRIAYMALQKMLNGKSEKLDGYTPEQRLFVGWAQVWCDNDRPESLRLRAQTNEHAADMYRVNGVVSNMPEFQKAYGCKAGAPMVRANACRVW